MEKFYTEEVEETVDTQPTEPKEIEESVELTDTLETEVEETKVAEKEEVKMISMEEAEKMAIERANNAVEARLKRERKQFDKELAKYKNTESILNAGLGTESIDDANVKLADFYKKQGVAIPEFKSGLSDREVEILAKAEAEEIIDLGIDEMTREANSLASKGYANLDPREKVIFTTLADRLTRENQKQELKKIGIESSVLEDKDFKDFIGKFNIQTPITDIYNLYSKTHEIKKPIEKIGSMKSIESPLKVKEYYTQAEVESLTSKDLDNPDILKAVEQSMAKW